MIHFGGGNVCGRLKHDFFMFWVHFDCHLSAYICSIPVTIGVYMFNSCHYRCIFVQCLSLSTYICPMPVTIGLYLSNAVRNHRKRYDSKYFEMIWNSSPELSGTLQNPPNLPGVTHLLQFGTSSTRARDQDDVSSNQLPQIKAAAISENRRLARNRCQIATD